MTIEKESELLLETAREAALSVGDQLVAAFRTAMDKDFKRDLHDIVTEHDKASEKQIISVILAAVSDSTIVGEEGGKSCTGRVHWYISIAAVIEGRVVAGVIYNPVAGDLFSAHLSGAWLNGRPLIARASTDEVSATIVSSFPSAHDLELFGTEALTAHGKLLDRFQAVRNLGSAALDLAHVAAGWADATMGFSTSPWDVAAGVLILEQAGGSYFGYSKGALESPSFLAPDYFGVGGGASYPTLQNIVEDLSGASKEH